MNKTIALEKDQFLINVLSGLRKDQKMIPSKYFYDEKGSQLFDEICELEEYYPTRTEQKIMEDNIEEIISCIKNDALFFEFGSGSSTKTKLLLEHLNQIKAYLPIDISEVHLLKTATNLKENFRNLEVSPIVADYTEPIEFPTEYSDYHSRVAYFPGSSIGNFTNMEAREFLKMVAQDCGSEGSLLIGFDLIKNVNVLNDAYNDSKGITAEFNLNLLSRLITDYQAEISIEKFLHKAFYNIEESRIEMHLESIINQRIKIADEWFEFKKGETILTEYSYKYSLESFKKLIEGVFEIRRYWTDQRNYFGILFLDVIK